MCLGKSSNFCFLTENYQNRISMKRSLYRYFDNLAHNNLSSFEIAVV